MIVHEGSEWILKTADGSKVLGRHKTKEEAEAQERAVEASKHSDGASRVNRFDRDASTLKAPERTPEGYLRVDGRIARIGVQMYRDGAGGMRRELRIPEEVFDEESLASFRQIPVTNGHPPVMLDSKNAKQYAVGATGENVRKDGDFIAAPLLIFDAGAIAAAEAGRSQLSNGYSCSLDETQDPALVAKYGKYDSIQRKIRGNHCAIVDAARAGPEARMRLDACDAESVEFGSSQATVVGSNTRAQEPKTMAYQLKIDGFNFEVTDPNAQAAVDRVIANVKKDGDDKLAIEKTRADNATKLHGDLQAEHSALKAKHDNLVDKVKTDGAATVKVEGVEITVGDFFDSSKRDAFLQKVCDTRVKTRSALLADARRLLGANEKLDGLDDLAIKKLVILKFKPEAKLDGADPVYVQGRYDGVLEDAAKVSPIDAARAAITTPPATDPNAPRADHAPSDDPEAARKAMQNRLLSANKKNGAHR